MKKVIRLTESDLTRIVKRVITESLEKRIKDQRSINIIKDDLGDVTSGTFVLKPGPHTGIEIRHPKFKENKKSTIINLNDVSGISSSGTWTINGTYIIFR